MAYIDKYITSEILKEIDQTHIDYLRSLGIFNESMSQTGGPWEEVFSKVSGMKWDDIEEDGEKSKGIQQYMIDKFKKYPNLVKAIQNDDLEKALEEAKKINN